MSSMRDTSQTTSMPRTADTAAQRHAGEVPREGTTGENGRRDGRATDAGSQRRELANDRVRARELHEPEQQLILDCLQDGVPIAEIHKSIVGESTDPAHQLAKADEMINAIRNAGGEELYQEELREIEELRRGLSAANATQAEPRTEVPEVGIDLLASGEEIASRIVSQLTFVDLRYRHMAERHVIEVIRALRAVNMQVSRANLIRYTHLEELQDLSYDLPQTGNPATDPGVWLRTYLADLPERAGLLFTRMQDSLLVVLGSD